MNSTMAQPGDDEQGRERGARRPTVAWRFGRGITADEKLAESWRAAAFDPGREVIPLVDVIEGETGDVVGWRTGNNVTLDAGLAGSWRVLDCVVVPLIERRTVEGFAQDESVLDVLETLARHADCLHVNLSGDRAKARERLGRFAEAVLKHFGGSNESKGGPSAGMSGGVSGLEAPAG
jgi:hypothetical protein